jgi:hypothetical protein
LHLLKYVLPKSGAIPTPPSVAIRDLNAGGKRTLPEHVPTGFVKPRWRPHVYASGGVDRHFYELCAA